VEGSGHFALWGAVSQFAWKNWEIRHQISVRLARFRLWFETGSSRIQRRGVTAWASLPIWPLQFDANEMATEELLIAVSGIQLLVMSLAGMVPCWSACFNYSVKPSSLGLETLCEWVRGITGCFFAVSSGCLSQQRKRELQMKFNIKSRFPSVHI